MEQEAVILAEPEDPEAKEHKDIVASTVIVQPFEIIVHLTTLKLNDALNIKNSIHMQITGPVFEFSCLKSYYHTILKIEIINY